MKSVLSVAVALSAAGAFASPWFDTGISSYDSWPTDGSDKVVEGQGTWGGTLNASLLDSRLKIDTVTGEAALVFDPAVQKSTESAELIYSMTTRFTVCDESPEADSAVKCGVSAIADGGETNYCGLAKDPSGATNVWVSLDGVTPDDAREVALTIRMKQEKGLSYVCYAIDGTLLTCDGEAWLEIADAADMTGAVAFRGSGDVSALSAEVETEAPAVTKALTIPAIDNVTVAHVRVAGVEVAADGEGRYVVEQGSVVTVSFEPVPGYALDVASMTFAVKDDMELPATGRPKAINVAAQITINEVMAKNDVTLRTKKGYEGLDWVELRNNSDEVVDITGWYFFNDSSKAVSKWTKIQGSCVIPARGYKIVWCDKDEVCPDSGFAADEAFVRFNVSTDGGKTIFLATTDGKIFTELPLPGGIKDVSYGLGHLSRTVVSANASAEYKVGAGDWTTVDGPVGMSSAVSDFKVVTYTCNREIANMDQAEAILKDSSAWTEVRTNLHPRIAFAGSNQTVNFPSDLYCGFDTTAVEKFIVVATGTVQIPRSGDWSFDVCSDDGFTASLSRLGKPWSWESRGTRGYQHSTAAFNLEAGSYEVTLVYFQNGGGYALDFSAAEGRYSNFDLDKFNLVGMAESGIVHAGALGAEVAADVSTEMVGKSKTLDWRTTFTMDEAPGEGDAFHLLVRYADGFTAKLNGETVASVAADGARTAAEALQRVSFPVDAKFVKKGENTLEITGENDKIDDTEFYLSAELVHDLENDQFVYFPTPTPEAANVTDGRTGFTPEVTFGTAHGWKDAAFDLTLACPSNETAVIYYTLDGTSPKVGAAGTFRYDAPIHVDKTTVVRAAVPDVDSILQVDRSATYLFYEDVIAQGSEPPPGFPEDGKVNRQKMLYGMSKVITEGDDDTKARLKRGLTENCRTVSFVIDPRNLFDGASGIFVNASGNGRDWERPTMVEQINPMDPEDEFCVPAGLRIRGAFSRGPEHPKHSFRLFFRSEYGMGTLEHKMFGDEGTDEFEKLDFRTSQNYGWGNGENGDTLIHELWSRDSEGAMGKTYNRTRYYHLFINGTYWGLYMTEERVDDNYAASYNGGTATDYDVIRTSQPGYSTGVTEGEAGAWTELWRLTTQEGYGVAHPENYNRVRGLNPDGTRNENYPILLNAENLIGHILTAHFAQDSDSPVNSGGMANNIIGFRNRFDGKGTLDGFLWNRHDAEHSLGFGGGANNVDVIKYGTPEHVNPNRNLREIGNFNPNLLHWELMSNAEYRVVFADLVYRHMVKKGGALTAEEGEKRFRARMAEIDDAIVAESARWGYQYGHTDHNRDGWLRSCTDRINFINNRLKYLIPEYQRRGWYPQTRTMTLVDGFGAAVAEGTTVGADERVYLASPDGGTVYYTTDGSDPRAEGGSPATGATKYEGGSPILVAEELFKRGADWTFYDKGGEPSGDWKAADYADSDWKSGKGVIGFGGNVGTCATAMNRYESDGKTQVNTFYFRKTITLPEGAENFTKLTGKVYCDDGFVAYVNGVEVGRQNMPAGAVTYATQTPNSINPTEENVEWTFPAGTLHEGENILAVEVHQCNSTSSDACWDLALNYLRPEAGEGGLAIPATGATIAARVLKDGEWSPLETISVKGSMPRATPAEALRVAAVMSSAPGGDKDDFLVLTNVSEGAVSLEGVKLVAWNAKKKTEADPSLTLTFGADRELAPGEALTLTAAADFGAGKLADSDVGIRLYDVSGGAPVLFQDAYVSADWFGGVCDGGGAYFVAKEFGAEVKGVSQWKPSETWVSLNLRFYEIEGIPAEGDDDAGEYFVLSNLSETVELDLTGVKIVIGKKEDIEKDGDSAAKCIVTLAGGSVAAHSTLKFKQPDYGWNKITNGDLILKIYDAEGALVQYSEIAQKSFAGYMAGQKALRATSFERETGTGDWTEVDLPQSGSKVEGDGFLFYLAGEFTEPAVIAPTGDTCCVILDGATVPGLTLLGAGEFTILASNENQVASLSASAATVTVEGDGALRFEGANTLVSVLDLTVKSGTFAVKSTGVSATKTPVVNVLGSVYQTGGVIDVDLDVATDLQIYGIYVANKDMDAKFSGGTFTAKVGGTKSAAIYGEKGSVNPAFSGDIAVSAMLTGPEARLVNAEGNVKLEGGVYDITMLADCASLTNARVFKATKDIKISGGTFTVEVPAAGSEIFSSDRVIDVSGGVLSLQSADDCFSATGDITISDGIVHALSTAGDAIDSNGSVTISGGRVFAFTLSPDHDAIDVDPMATEESSVEHNITILDGATVVAVGGDQEYFHKPDVGSTATIYAEKGLASEKKYVELTGVVAGVDAKTTTVLSVNWNKRHADTFTLIATMPGYDGQGYAETDTKPDTKYKLNDNIDGVFLRETVEETAKPIEPGLVIEVTAADAEAAKAQVVLKVTVPTDPDTSEPVVDEATYKGYFVLEAKPVADKPGVFAVEAVLDEAVVKPVIEATGEIETPFAVGETGGEVTVATKPGLYYSLVRGAKVGKIDSVRDCKLATGATVGLADTEKLPDAAFYRVKVSVTEQKIEQEDN